MGQRRRASGIAAATAALAVACTAGPRPPAAARDAWLVERAREAGLDFVHDCGTQRTYFLPELMGPGCALLDYDGDGDLDAYFVNGGPPPGASGPAPTNRLYRQGPDGSFTDVTAASGAGDRGFGMGVIAGDYDNDGHVDLYVTNYGPDTLYRNQGDGTFRDVTAEAGLGTTRPRWSASAAFLDIDADGWLDLYVTGYLELDPRRECPDAAGRIDYCGPTRFPGVADALYRNRGDGTFADVSRQSGIGAPALRGLGVVAADLSGDGRVDIYVANDNDPNLLWVNRGDGTFVDEAVPRGVAFNEGGRAESGMGIACADLDGDADLDLLVTHLRDESDTAYFQGPPGLFGDGTAGAGLLLPSLPRTGFGVVDLDVDHDGDLDLAGVHGHVFRAPPDPRAAPDDFWSDYAQPGVLLEGLAGGRFRVASTQQAGSFGTDPWVGRGLAAGDIDGDGDLDLLATASNGRARLFVNDAPKRGHWLLVRAVDPGRRRDAEGAVITVVIGERRLVRLVTTAGSYLSSRDPRAHFGLGPVAAVDAIEVRWPDGPTERFAGVTADRRVTLERGAGR